MTAPTDNAALRGLLDDADHAGILIRAAEQEDVAAQLHRTAFHDGLTDDNSVAEWCEKKARTFRHAAAVLATDRHAEGRIAGLEEAARIADASAATCVPLMKGIGVAASVETGRHRAATEIAAAIRTIANRGTAA